MRKLLIIIASLALCLTLQAQRPIAYHSHNDYNRTAPFWEAYSQHCTSIEADVFLHDGEILVAHNREDVSADRSLRTMYIEPIAKVFRENGGRMWEGSSDRLQLMVDLKTSESLPGVLALAEEFPDVFTTPNGVKIVFTGDIPDPKDFGKYPEWVWFDGDFTNGKITYTPEQLHLSFLDAQSYLDSVEERAEDPELADELLARSGYAEFIETLNAYVAEKTLTSKLTTDLYVLDNELDKAISDLTPGSEDADIDALEENLKQQRHMLIDTRTRMQREVTDIFSDSAAKIREYGLDAAALVDTGLPMEELQEKIAAEKAAASCTMLQVKPCPKEQVASSTSCMVSLV